MNDSTLSLLRAVLKLGAGYAIAKGVTDDKTAEILIGGVVGAVGVVWGCLHRSEAPATAKPEDKRQIPLLALAGLALLMAGCTSVTITQRETDLDGYTRETTFKGRSVWDAHNELAKARSTMTDKGQGFSLAGLTQESSATNVVALAERAAAAAAEGTARAFLGGGVPKLP